MRTINEICDWFRVQNSKKMEKDPNVEPINVGKLYGLLYFAQGLNLATNNQPLFKDSIINNKFGINIPTLDKKFKKYNILPSVEQDGDKLDNYSNLNKNEKDSHVLNIIDKTFGNMSAVELERSINLEAPVQNTSVGKEIKPAVMKKYFSKHMAK